MADNETLTFALEGEVNLDTFADAMRRFQELVANLSKQIAPKSRVVWMIESLVSGSAVATVRARSDTLEPVLRIVNGYEVVGKALSRGEQIPYADSVIRPALALAKMTEKPGVTEVRFETPRVDYTVNNHVVLKAEPALQPRLGTVKGTVETLHSRGALRFTLYDSIFDRAVSCYASEDSRELMVDIWGKRVAVVGRVSRNTVGQPTAIREITDIGILPEPPDPMSFTQARGVFAWSQNDEPAEVAIRRIRDVED